MNSMKEQTYITPENEPPRSEDVMSCPPAHQTPLSMEFSRQDYSSGLLLPPPGDLPDPGIKPRSPALQTNSLPSEPPGKDRGQLLISQERMKRLGQSRNDTQLWMCLLVKVKPDAVKNNIA